MDQRVHGRLVFEGIPGFLPIDSLVDVPLADIGQQLDLPAQASLGGQVGVRDSARRWKVIASVVVVQRFTDLHEVVRAPGPIGRFASALREQNDEPGAH